jgi:N utilization substance protein B
MLYQRHFHKLTLLDVETHQVEDFGEDLEFENLSRKLQKKLTKSAPQVETTVNSVWADREELDKLIAKFAPAWPLNQVNPVDLQIIRLAVYEGFVEKSIPSKVAIDEAIELARDFGGEGNIKFVSGVLGSIYNSYK